MAKARGSVTVHMPEHLEHASTIRDEIAMGRLEAARPAARVLADHWPDQVLVDWLPYVVDLRSAAAAVADAKDLPEASTAAAQLALACGRCHAAMKQGPEFPQSTAPEAGADMRAAMRRHRWATDRLWEGVVQARDEPWKDGVQALGELPPCQENSGGEQLEKAITRSRDQISSFVEHAAAAQSIDARAQKYGELLGSCSGCHLSGC